MAYSLRVIGPRQQGVLAAYEFFPGEERTITLQVYELDDNDPVPIPTGAIKTLELAAYPEAIQIDNADITVDTSDPSIFSAVLSEIDTTAMQAGAIKFTFVKDGITRIAVLELGLNRLFVIL